jgi:O-acetylhomoserine/O-acetylserine sulfhydrylase-like pyridoxal-dependent enzyme
MEQGERRDLLERIVENTQTVLAEDLNNLQGVLSDFDAITQLSTER